MIRRDKPLLASRLSAWPRETACTTDLSVCTVAPVHPCNYVYNGAPCTYVRAGCKFFTFHNYTPVTEAHKPDLMLHLALQPYSRDYIACTSVENLDPISQRFYIGRGADIIRLGFNVLITKCSLWKIWFVIFFITSRFNRVDLRMRGYSSIRILLGIIFGLFWIGLCWVILERVADNKEGEEEKNTPFLKRINCILIANNNNKKKFYNSYLFSWNMWIVY